MSNFAKVVEQFTIKAGKNARAGVIKIAAELNNRVILKTPVDQGRLRANWQLSIKRPAVGQVQGTDKSGSLTAAKNITSLAQYQLGDLIFLVNNLPYARIVEFGLFGKPPGSANGPKTIKGYSSQTPQGMARISVREVVAGLKK